VIKQLAIFCPVSICFVSILLQKSENAGERGDLIAWPIPSPSTAIRRAALGDMRPM